MEEEDKDNTSITEPYTCAETPLPLLTGSPTQQPSSSSNNPQSSDRTLTTNGDLYRWAWQKGHVTVPKKLEHKEKDRAAGETLAANLEKLRNLRAIRNRELEPQTCYAENLDTPSAR